MTVLTLSEVEAIIAERIVAGPAFRESFPADPRAVLVEVCVDIPESVQVVLHEESLTQIHMTIPASDALTDDDLEFVAGGEYKPWGCGYGAPGSFP